MYATSARGLQSFPRFTFLHCATCGHKFLNQVVTSPSCPRCGDVRLHRLGLDRRAAAAVGDGVRSGQR